MPTQYKFQNLEVYKLSLSYVQSIYSLCKKLPEVERYNLSSQIQRAATSITLNIAEGSTGQSDPEQYRFLGLALRSYLETIACLDIIQNQKYQNLEELTPIREQGHQLFIKISSLRKSLNSRGSK
jgi:four helix bundle protein